MLSLIQCSGPCKWLKEWIQAYEEHSKLSWEFSLIARSDAQNTSLFFVLREKSGFSITKGSTWSVTSSLWSRDNGEEVSLNCLAFISAGTLKKVSMLYFMPLGNTAVLPNIAHTVSYARATQECNTVHRFAPPRNISHYYPTALRRVQITPKTSTNITRYLYRGPVRQVSCHWPIS